MSEERKCARPRHVKFEGHPNPLWKCAKCERWWHALCSGSDDAFPDWCDECWATRKGSGK